MRSAKASLAALCFAVFSLVMGACAAEPGKPMRLPVDSEALEIVTASGTKLFDVEIADDNTERAQGLMFRTDLPQNRAMLFDFGTERAVAMWMKNTPLPLDMLFVDQAGRITQIIADTVPFSEDVLASTQPVRFVIEINGGGAVRAAIAPGNMVRHPAIGG